MNELDAFLDKLEKELGFLDHDTARDIREEIRSHILDSAEASGRSVEEIVNAMGSPQDIARRYRDEFGAADQAPHQGIHVDFAPDEEEGKEREGCPGGNGPWPNGCWGDRMHSRRRPHGPWEEMGRTFGRMGREFGRMARDWARDAEGSYEKQFREAGRQMRDFFKDTFSSDEHDGETREVEFSYPKAKACRFDFTSAKISVKKGSGENIILRVKLRGRSDGSAPWKPQESRSGDASLSLTESFACPPFSAAFAKRVEIEIPDGVESVELRSISGAIKAEGMGVSVKATSASGDIVLSGVSGEASCRTASGDIRLSGIAGKIDANAISGDVRLSLNRGRLIEYSSVSGKVKIYGGKAVGSGSIPGGEPPARLRTVSGDIEVEDE
jgi:hypothetical protein